MELSTIIGLGGGLFAVILTLIIEGGNLLAFVNFGALVLILGGSFAVGIASFGLKEFLLMPKYFLKTIFPPASQPGEMILSFVSFSEKSRREGLLSLEEDVKDIDDPMIRLGLQLVIDGNDPEIVRSILEDLGDSISRDEKIPAEFFETLGGFSPTLGIIGTVMGLVHVLANLGGSNMEQLGKGIAVAFIATFYGIGFANLLWLPLSNKVKKINKQMVERRDIILAGILAIQSGDNPRIVKEKLLCHISDPGIRESVGAMAGVD